MFRRIAGMATVAAALATVTNANAQSHDAGHAAQPTAPTTTSGQPVLQVSGAVSAPLAKGLVVLPFSAEGAQIAAIYGDAATGMTPPPAHLHVKIDGASWHWVHASPDPVVIQGLPAGPHSVELVLADGNHRPLQKKTVSFTIAAK